MAGLLDLYLLMVLGLEVCRGAFTLIGFSPFIEILAGSFGLRVSLALLSVEALDPTISL